MVVQELLHQYIFDIGTYQEQHLQECDALTSQIFYGCMCHSETWSVQHTALQVTIELHSGTVLACYGLAL